LLEEIKKNETLLEVNATRFQDKFNDKAVDLIMDDEKHMLAFDIIYCCSSYNLFEGIHFTKLNLNEKKVYLKEKEKANQLLEENKILQKELSILNEAKQYYMEVLKPNSKMNHKKYGKVTIESIDEEYISILFGDDKKKLGLNIALGNEIITSSVEGFKERLLIYGPILKKEKTIESSLKRIRGELQSLEDYIE
ncbi:hypothetical protein, partial [Petrocella sp. FN5]|uniref:hypothetical protein n=1 Tax=Petrocella sp. FN5 TaxID=3032002 RepID=UPI0023DC7BD2